MNALLKTQREGVEKEKEANSTEGASWARHSFDRSAVHIIKCWQGKNKQCLLFVLLINNRPFEHHASHASIVYSDNCVMPVCGLRGSGRGHCDWQLGVAMMWAAAKSRMSTEPGTDGALEGLCPHRAPLGSYSQAGSNLSRPSHKDIIIQ